ncbi:MAG: hypothetical protein WCP20_23205 [Desulfuromonadales bacterium]
MPFQSRAQEIAHAQYEIRQYANTIGNEIVSKWIPHTWAAFLDYRLNSISLSGTEIGFMVLLNSGKQDVLLENMSSLFCIQLTRLLLLMVDFHQIQKLRQSATMEAVSERADIMVSDRTSFFFSSFSIALLT